jgi:hypothetical protein
MKIYFSVALGGLLSGVAILPAHAETDLAGKWIGQFVGVQIEIPTERGPFGQPREDAKESQAPKFIENTLQLDIGSQNKGLAVGTWTAGEFKKHFVCAQTSSTIWNCIDSGGRASVETLPTGEIKVCYFDNREGAQGAGCATLRRAK